MLPVQRRLFLLLLLCNVAETKRKSLSKGKHEVCLQNATVEQHYDKQAAMAEMALQIYRDNATLTQTFQKEWTLLHSYTVKSGLLSSEDKLQLYRRRGECSVVFEGTDESTDWLTNVNMVPWPSRKCGGFWIHTGFRKELRRLTSAKEWPKVQETLSGSECSAGIYAVGHSLGGAMASVFTACVNAQAGYFEGNPFRVKELYSFGAPLVSFRHPLAEANGQCLKGARFYNEDEDEGHSHHRWIDPVVTLPPLLGWFHPKLKAIRLTQVDGEYEEEEFACDSREATSPSLFLSDWKKVSLHNIQDYIKRVKGADLKGNVKKGRSGKRIPKTLTTKRHNTRGRSPRGGKRSRKRPPRKGIIHRLRSRFR